MVKRDYNEKLEYIKLELIKYLITKEDNNLVTNENEIFTSLGLTSAKDKKVLRKVLNRMSSEESIIYDKKRGHIKLKTNEYSVGEVVLNGINDFAVDCEGRKVSVRSNKLKGAYVGDKVLFSNKEKRIKGIIGKSNNPRIFECIRVDNEVKVIPFNIKDSYNYVFVDNKPIILTGNEIISADVKFIDSMYKLTNPTYYNDDKGIKEDYVFSGITYYDTELLKCEEGIYECRIREVLGSRTESEISGKIVLASNGIDINFDKKALEEASLLPDFVTQKEMENRVDLRGLKTFSIDNNSSRCVIDDAVSVEMNKDGNFLVYLHMVDVAHYVKPGTALFNEARKRSRTIHLHNYRYVHPMLPEKLSYGICSLLAGKDRLTKTISLEFDSDGNLVAYDFFDSIVNVDKNFGSVEADKVYYAGNDKYDPNYNEKFIKEFSMLHKTNEFINSLLFLSDTEKPDNMDRIMTNIIKIANEEVANHFPTLPFIYKTFEYPAKKEIVRYSRTNNFKKRMEACNFEQYNFVKYDIVDEILEYYGLPNDNKYRLAVHELLKLKPYFFSTNNRRHFGLGVARYTHINSPARSFVNLVNQLLFDLYNTEFDPSEEALDKLQNELQEICDEYNANTSKYKKIEKLTPHVRIEEQHDIGGIAKGVIIDKKHNKFIIKVEDDEMYNAISPDSGFNIGDEVLIKTSKSPSGVVNHKAKILRYKN